MQRPAGTDCNQSNQNEAMAWYPADSNWLSAVLFYIKLPGWLTRHLLKLNTISLWWLIDQEKTSVIDGSNFNICSFLHLLFLCLLKVDSISSTCVLLTIAKTKVFLCAIILIQPSIFMSSHRVNPSHIKRSGESSFGMWVFCHVSVVCVDGSGSGRVLLLIIGALTAHSSQREGMIWACHLHHQLHFRGFPPGSMHVCTHIAVVLIREHLPAWNRTGSGQSVVIERERKTLPTTSTARSTKCF